MSAKYKPSNSTIIDTTGFRLFWNDVEVSEDEYKKLEHEAMEYNERLAREKAELDAPAKKKRKKATLYS